jgi:hypothetical protein
VFVTLAYAGVCMLLGLGLLEHSPYDSYTLQAMLWRSGHVSMGEDIPYLELAVYEGRYYVSFPPFPTVPMLLLTLAFGENTPSRLVSMLLFIGSYWIGYLLAHRRGLTDGRAAFFACFLVAGCNMMEFGLFGGVWNVAQTIGFFLTLAALYGADSPRRPGRAWGLVSLACAVGCRPFQALYVPLALWLCWLREREQCGGARRALRRLAPLLVAPALIAALYGAYNAIRFGNPLEFGHSYLPEFTRTREGQFSLSYVAGNFFNILRLPYFRDGLLLFPSDSGFAFYLANPIFLLAAVVIVWGAVRRRLTGTDGLILVTLAVHFFALLMHKSFGGVQFGTRYLCDLVPVLYYLILRDPGRVPWKLSVPVMGWGIAFNIYGAIVFQHYYLGQGWFS